MGERVTKDESSNIFTHQGAAQAIWTAKEKGKHSKGSNLFQRLRPLLEPCKSNILTYWGLVLVLFLAHQNAVKANTFLRVPHTEAHSEAVRDFN